MFTGTPTVHDSGPRRRLAAARSTIRRLPVTVPAVDVPVDAPVAPDGGCRPRPATSVSKALQLLSAFRRARTDLSLTELAQRADIPKSTAFRLLGELEQAGFVARNGTKYRLGVSLFELGSRVSLCRPQGLRDTAVHYLSQLHAGTGGLTAHLAVLEGAEILYLEKIHGPRTPRVRTMPGQRYPASTTALGKAMVALGDAEDLAAVLAHGLPRMTRSSITDPDRFVEELRGVRRAGVARDREEAVTGLVCVAAPIVVHGVVEGAVSVSGPSAGFAWERMEALVRSAAAGVAQKRAIGVGWAS
nr:IclR family transcriptional regulator [Nocardioides sp. zg-DK7169]